jgi:hypothetical protein
MKNNNLRLSLSKQELWHLANFFGPGWIYGVENPYEDFSDEQITTFEKQASSELEKEGFIKISNTNQIQVDEMLGGMVYSCIHSNHLLILNTANGKEKRFYHFLPDWQLELFKSNDEYSLTLFKERSDLFPHIIKSFDVNLQEKSQDVQFSIGVRDLELAAFLFESGKQQKAEEIFKTKSSGEIPSAEKFLYGYLNPNFHFIFSMLYERNDEKRIHSTKNELIQVNETLYWISHDEVGEEELLELLSFSSVSAEEAEHRFNLMLPEN